MSLSNSILMILAAWLFATGIALAGDAGTVLKDSEIKSSPYLDAKPMGALARGDKVDILKKQGGWYQVKSAKGSGWVRMLSIRRGEARKASIDAGGILGLSSGRSGTGQVVATTGIRGLTEEELKKAKYNEAELKKVESFTVSDEELRKFAAQGKLVVQKVDYLSAPK
ncbi:MAG: SH3 domain-containing protein [Deltaproteobacteria bacterium]|nr:SH3 domain-containing protein [Deltaproteobacteria bacterium]MDZ4344833.1 SH3 domain-containing protein [Candidatus Binatia bacterium]